MNEILKNYWNAILLGKSLVYDKKSGAQLSASLLSFYENHYCRHIISIML